MVKENLKKDTLNKKIIKKDSIKKSSVKKKNLNNYKLKKGGLLFFKKSFNEKYISYEKGLISLFFSENTTILKKIDISKNINNKLITLLKMYSKSYSQTDSTNIYILINEISSENLKQFTQKTLNTNFFVNTDFLNIDLNKIFDNNTDISDYAKNYFIDIYYKIVLKYVGNNNKFFKIHEFYNILLTQNKEFFKKIILFIKDKSTLYSFNINYIIIILYTYTTTNLKDDFNNKYFPHNYYEIIIKSFFEFIKKNGYPAMDKSDYYSTLKYINNTEINNLNTFNTTLKLTDIILHPSFTGNNLTFSIFKNNDNINYTKKTQTDFSPVVSTSLITTPSPKSITSSKSTVHSIYTTPLQNTSEYSKKNRNSNINKSKSFIKNTSGKVSPLRLGYNSNYNNSFQKQESAIEEPIPDSSFSVPTISLSTSSLTSSKNNTFGLQSLSNIDSEFESNVHFDSNVSTHSNLFSNKADLKNAPHDYKGFLKLLEILNDNNEYGYRWKKLTCDFKDFNKYGCNNLNYDLNDLRHNNIIINSCNTLLECKEYNKILNKYYKFYVNTISKKENAYPENQIEEKYKNIFFEKISKLIFEIKNKNIFKDVIIIDSELVYIAYNKFKKYNLNFQDSNIYIELSDKNKILLKKLTTASASAYGIIYHASLFNYSFAVKLSLCDNVNDINYLVQKQSNLKEIHLFDIVTKYAITNININLPIIYKTIQLNVNRTIVGKIFGENAWKNYNRHNIGCNLGKEPPINCSIVELYSGDCNKYIMDFYKNNKIDYFKYLLSGFENIIISILSFWSVTKCVHNDAHLGNFLFKLTNDKHDFNKYNIHGKSFYISTYTKCKWTLWDYGSCMPFLYENYFEKDSDSVFYRGVLLGVIATLMGFSSVLLSPSFAHAGDETLILNSPALAQKAKEAA